jgi:hypothetical protein
MNWLNFGRYPIEKSNRRAQQRTFEAAYWRTSLSQFAFALVILKIFQKQYYAIGGMTFCGGLDGSVIHRFRVLYDYHGSGTKGKRES